MLHLLRGLLIALLTLPLAGALPIEPGRVGRQPLAGHLEILEKTQAWTLEEALQASAQGRFRPLQGNVSKGYSSQIVWVRFTLRVPEGGAPEAWLELPPAFIQELSLFLPRPGGGFEAASAGGWEPFTSRQVAFRTVVFKLGGRDHPLTGPEATCYVRVRTRGNMLLRPILWTPQAFTEAIARGELFYGAFFGAAFLVLAASFLYWLKLREPALLLYCIHLACFILLMVGLEGFASQYLFPGSARAFTLLVPLVSSLQPWLYAATFSTFAEFGAVHPKADRAYRALGASLVALTLLSICVGHFYTANRLLQPLLLLLLLINSALAIVLGLRRHRAAWTYLVSFGPIIVGGILRLGWAVGLGPHAFWGEHALHVGAVVHFFLLTLLMTRRLDRIRRERDHAIQAALAAAESHQKELEARVEARTAELREGKARIAEALDRERLLVAEQKQFLSLVSHEFRTPLAVIDGAAQMARLAVKPPTDDLASSTSTIRRSVAELLHLLDGWLAKERIASGVWEPRFEPVSLCGLLEELVHRAQPVTNPHRILLHVGFLPEAYPCDGDLLRAAIQNLVNNAMKYSPDDAPVQVDAGLRDGWVCLEVADRGRGIPADQLGQITARFIRGRNTGQVPGLGLGLSLVEAIAKLHGGRFEIVSLEGRGTTARILLPRGASEEA